jgi:methyl-accepting chemotaxis protein
MSLFKKMLLAPGAALLLMLLVGAFGLHALREQRSHLVELAEVRMANAAQAHDMQSAARSVHGHAYRMLTWSASVGGDHAEKEAGRVLAELDQATAALTGWAAQAVLDDKEREFAERIAAASARYRKALATAMDMATVDVASGVAAMQTADERFQGLDHEADELLALERQGAATAVAWADSAYRRMVWIGVALIATAALVAAGASLVIARRVAGALAQAVATARAVAAGDLAVQIPRGGADEIGRLLEALQVMRDNLGSIVGRVRANAESVAVASSEIAQGNSDLSVRTESQASVLQETASSMEELGGAVRSNADHARRASDLASSASGVARKGGEAVDQVVSTMREIDEASRRISEIVGLIDGIAFQTNILALNAAVEAARAGEHGRSFAVVAAEVRNLAQRSAEAARSIKQLVATSTARVERGSALAANAGATMQEVVGSIQHVSGLIAEISIASGEQGEGVSQVGIAVQQMDQATQQNAALVEESAAAAESLKQQARQLVDAMAVFKLAATAD